MDGGDQMSKICLNCGNKVEDTAHFCNICGTEMNEPTCASNASPEPEPAPPTEQICPSCGKTVPIDSKFCRYCGEALKKESENTTQQSAPTDFDAAYRAIIAKNTEYYLPQFQSIAYGGYLPWRQ